MGGRGGRDGGRGGIQVIIVAPATISLVPRVKMIFEGRF